MAANSSPSLGVLELRQDWDGRRCPLRAQNNEENFTTYYNESVDAVWASSASTTRKAFIVFISDVTTANDSSLPASSPWTAFIPQEVRSEPLPESESPPSHMNGTGVSDDHGQCLSKAVSKALPLPAIPRSTSPPIARPPKPPPPLLQGNDGSSSTIPH